MKRLQHAVDLHRSAIAGDDEGVKQALASGFDINALDATGRTALMCAIAGDDWEDIDASNASYMTTNRLNTIRTILTHPDISLFTLNAPNAPMNGVIPLGMAAWLDFPNVVRLLLEDSADGVSVDGVDSHGATALMYAARDGNLDVVKLLLLHGARPDFRDCNHRTSVQFALGHPQILWLCETVLRRHRWRENSCIDRRKLFSEDAHLLELARSALPSADDIYSPPPISVFSPESMSRLTDTLKASIEGGDLSFLTSLLFSPALPSSSPSALYPMSAPLLINQPDSKGWSPIHHCVATKNPSVQVLDLLYCAGADVSLFTEKEQRAPLHILAQSANILPCDHDAAAALYEFTAHLIQDLRSPLSAKDKNDETCIHIAAEHGKCINVLIMLLDCDTTGAVRELKNSRGLTAFEVSKPEYSVAFGTDSNRSSTPLGNPLRATESFASLASFSELNLTPTLNIEFPSISSPELDISVSAQRLIANLRLTSTIIDEGNPAHLELLENIEADTTQLSRSILEHFRGRLHGTVKEINTLRKTSERIATLRSAVRYVATGRLAMRGLTPISEKKRTRDSEDSQATAVSQYSETADSTNIGSLPRQASQPISHNAGSQAKLNSPSEPSYKLSALLNPADLSVYKSYLDDLWQIERALEENDIPGEPSTPVNNLLKKKRKLEEKIKELEGKQHAIKKSPSTWKLKSWIKRMVQTDSEANSRLELVPNDDDSAHRTRKNSKLPTFQVNSPEAEDQASLLDVTIDHALKTSHVVLDAAEKDLLAIEQLLASAEKFVELADSSIARAERVIKRALKKCEVMITKLRQAGDNSLLGRNDISPGLLGYSQRLSPRPSIISFSSALSNRSSVRSVAGTVTDDSDEDVRILRRLLLRKIDARTTGAWNEVDKAMAWLRVVMEVVRGVKRRAYL